MEPNCGETIQSTVDSLFRLFSSIGSPQMMRQLSERNFGRWLTHCSVGLAVLIFGSLPQAAYADEDGVSFWLPGHFSSLAATPQMPGWSMAEVYMANSTPRTGWRAGILPG